MGEQMTFVSTEPQSFSRKVQGVTFGSLLPPRTDLIQTADLAEAMAGRWAARELVHPACHGNPGNWHAWLLGGYWRELLTRGSFD